MLKKTCFFEYGSAKALTPELLADIAIWWKFVYIYNYVCFCKQQEKPEMDDFERKKTLVLKKDTKKFYI